MKVLFDTTILAAAVVTELGQHEPAFACFMRHTSGKNQGFCSTHALAECYATLTALPLKRRIQPAEAQRLIDETFRSRLTILDLPGRVYEESIRRASSLGLVRGVVYDALHLVGAERNGCERLYTHNVSRFQRLNPVRVQIATP